MNRPLMQSERPNVAERGANDQSVDTRLFMQMLVFTGCVDSGVIVENLRNGDIPGVLYEDVCDPYGVGILTWSEDPAFFVDQLRPLLKTQPFREMKLLPEMTMFGRTYSLGFEADLEHWLLRKPVQTAVNPAWPWGIWYPLRRKGSFATLPPEEQRKILMEHGRIGMSYVEHDFVHDIRLASHGLDRNDNDFVIGLVGKALSPLSKIVEAMRRTTQTSTYLETLGPFFVGKAVWQSDVVADSAT